MAKQTILGKAFEYACISNLFEISYSVGEVTIECNSTYEYAKYCFNTLDLETKENLNKSAATAIKMIVKLEPNLLKTEVAPLRLFLQDDLQGIKGDVRDILCIKGDWIIGLSCKHNHTAVKHSRLSDKIDFGKSWLNIPCSDEYFIEINSLFKELRIMKERNLKWCEIVDKEGSYYVPLLNAFLKELKKLDKTYPDLVPSRLLSYLLGKFDFYKIITDDKCSCTSIQAYNLYGTLNKKAKNIRPLNNIKSLKLPSRIFDIQYKTNSRNTIIVTFDMGWAVSFRIHNAATFIEPSLKFDIQLVGVPQSLHSQIENWNP